jgi:hypothetical protein
MITHLQPVEMILSAKVVWFYARVARTYYLLMMTIIQSKDRLGVKLALIITLIGATYVKLSLQVIHMEQMIVMILCVRGVLRIILLTVRIVIVLI